MAYQPVWNRRRRLAAVRVAVLATRPDAVDAAHVMQVLGEDWPAGAPLLIVSFQSPELQWQATRCPPVHHTWIELGLDAVHRAESPRGTGRGGSRWAPAVASHAAGGCACRSHRTVGCAQPVAAQRQRGAGGLAIPRARRQPGARAHQPHCSRDSSMKALVVVHWSIIAWTRRAPGALPAGLKTMCCTPGATSPWAVMRSPSCNAGRPSRTIVRWSSSNASCGKTRCWSTACWPWSTRLSMGLRREIDSLRHAIMMLGLTALGPVAERAAAWQRNRPLAAPGALRAGHALASGTTPAGFRLGGRPACRGVFHLAPEPDGPPAARAAGSRAAQGSVAGPHAGRLVAPGWSVPRLARGVPRPKQHRAPAPPAGPVCRARYLPGASQPCFVAHAGHQP